MIKIYCMQKDEDDILSSWIQYHSSIVGIKNIHLIDNGSSQKSLDILNEFKSIGLNVYYKSDYKKKGDYICDLIKENNKIIKHIAVPLDIDEFIGMCTYNPTYNLSYKESLIIHNCINFNINYYKLKYSNIFDMPLIPSRYKSTEQIMIYYIDNYLKNIYNKDEQFIENNPTYLKKMCTHMSQICIEEINNYLLNNTWVLGYLNPKYITCNPTIINKYLLKLKKSYDEKNNNSKFPNGRFSFSYYFNSINKKLAYTDPITEINQFVIGNIFSHNKKYFYSNDLEYLDHGNHYGKLKNESNNDKHYTITNLFLFHFHFRGIIKLIDKCINDIKGLNYDINNLNLIKKLSQTGIAGNHNLKTYVKFIEEGPYSLINNTTNVHNFSFNLKS
jgi:hypothetical protein